MTVYAKSTCRRLIATVKYDIQLMGSYNNTNIIRIFLNYSLYSTEVHRYVVLSAAGLGDTQ